MEPVDLADHSPTSHSNEDDRPLTPGFGQQSITEPLRCFTKDAQAFTELTARIQKLAEQLNESLAPQSPIANQLAAPGPQELREQLTELIRQSERKQDQLLQSEQQLLSSHQCIERLLNESRTDSLTLLLNRRALDEALITRLARITDQKHLSVALIDVDQLKQVNLAFGHPTGDRLLARLGSLLPSLLGENVTIARYGGDEFAVVMDEPLAACVKKIEQLRISLEKEDWSKTLRPSIARAECDAPRSCKISIGVSTLQLGTAKEDAFVNADHALYFAKCNGRNQTCYHNGETVLVA